MEKAPFLLTFLTCTVLSAQEFNLPTPKGNLVARVTSNGFYWDTFFKMAGTVTNNTDWNLSIVTLRVAFLDGSGAEITPLCPKERKHAYCVTSGVDIPAHGTVPMPEGPGIVVNSLDTGKLPKIAGYRLSFDDALYEVGYRFTLVKPSVNEDMMYEDADLGFKFVASPKGINCAIRNKTSDPVSINWNGVSFVDDSGEAHKIVRSGVRYMEKEASQPSTLVPPNARITETIFPTDRIVSTSRGWREKPLWPETEYVSGDASDLKGLKGSTFSVFLPMEIGGKTKNYSFVFRITSVAF